jgi:hypothetical protein
MLTIVGASQYFAPEPGFAALLKNPGKLVRTYPSGAIFVLTLDHGLTLKEIKVLNRKLDRIHEFHLGQSMGFMLKARAILKDADEFNPGRAVEQLRLALGEIKTDLEKYARLNTIEQFELDDEALFNAETNRANQILAHAND